MKRRFAAGPSASLVLLLPSACLRPSPLELPPFGEAKTAVLVHQEPSGGFLDGAVVFDVEQPAELSLGEGTSHLFLFRESVRALGVPAGVVFDGSGDRGPEPLLAYSRAGDQWAPLSPPRTEEFPLSIFHPVSPCERVLATGEPKVLWQQEMLRGVDLEDGRMLLADRAGALFHLETDDRLVLMGRLDRAPVGITSDDQGRTLLVVDDQGRLERWDLATLTSTVMIADASGLQLSAGMSVPVASLFVSSSGEIHVALTAVSGIPDQPNESRTAVASRGQWQRWGLDGCAEEGELEVTQSNRLGQANNGDLISLGNCHNSHLRRRPSGEVFKEVVPGLDTGTPFVIRSIRGLLHIGTRSGRVFREQADRTPGWGELASFGRSTVDDLEAFGEDGLIAAVRYRGFSNSLLTWFPSVGPFGHCAQPADTRFDGVTTNLVARGDRYLAATSSTGGRLFQVQLGPPPD